MARVTPSIAAVLSGCSAIVSTLADLWWDLSPAVEPGEVFHTQVCLCVCVESS